MQGPMIFITGALLALNSAFSVAAPEEFVYKKPSLDAASESSMRRVYDLINNPTGSAEQARLAILSGMLKTKGAAWVLEQEGEGYVLARWDYKGHTIFHRIEYTDKAVQIKYAGGLDDYQCERLVGDYCYKTHRNYYKYNQSLVKQIRIAFSRM